MSTSAAVKPTLLAFHGSGSNGTIHTVQLARLGRLLKPHFHIESLEAPFPSAAGPGILPFFEGCGPYKRWIPPSENASVSSIKQGEASSRMPAQVEALIRTAVHEIRSKGGHVAGLIGFSQGTRVVAGLLKGCEVVKALGATTEREAVVVAGLEWLDFAFALSVCGSYPPPLLPPSVTAALESSSVPPDQRQSLLESKIAVPTYHVQGAQDEWSWTGQLLIEHSYEAGEGKSVVMEAQMGHHYPARAEESETLRDWVLETYRKSVEGTEKP